LVGSRPATYQQHDELLPAVATGRVALGVLTDRFPAMLSYSPAQLARTSEDLVYIVRFVAAAQLVDDVGVFTTFLDWLTGLLSAGAVPAAALAAGLEALLPCSLR